MKAVGDVKRCSKCEQWLPLNEFAKGKSFADGLNNWCRACTKEYNDANHERRLAYNRGYVAANREKVNEYNRRYLEEHPNAREAAAKRSKRYYENHKAEVNRRAADWAADNPDRVKVAERAYYERNREARKAKVSQWRQDNPDQVARHHGIRRARLAGAAVEGTIDYGRIYKRDRGICYLCGRKVKKSERHLDHVIPLSRGGTHTEDNLRVTHARCNLIKGAKLVEELDPRRFE